VSDLVLEPQWSAHHPWTKSVGRVRHRPLQEVSTAERTGAVENYRNQSSLYAQLEPINIERTPTNENY